MACLDIWTTGKLLLGSEISPPHITETAETEIIVLLEKLLSLSTDIIFAHRHCYSSSGCASYLAWALGSQSLCTLLPFQEGRQAESREHRCCVASAYAGFKQKSQASGFFLPAKEEPKGRLIANCI